MTENNQDELIEMSGRMHIALEMLESCKNFAFLIPEVRSNLVYAKEQSENPRDVLAIDGRITVVDGMPKAAGKPRFGTSSHMARLMLEIRKTKPSIRAGIDFANDPDIAKWLEGYCRHNGLIFSVIDRSHEPDEIKEAEGASMPWKVAEAVRAAGGRVPNIFYETGAVGKEPVTVLIGEDPISVVGEMLSIAHSYRRDII